MNMWKRGISLAFILMVSSTFAQLAPYSFYKKKRFELIVKKTGPYFSLQQGKYLVPELGVERQWKQIKLATAFTHAIHMGFNYNFKYKVLGYDVGYWVKPSRIGLTYGGNLILRTDFDETRLGFAPVIGYKLVGFHLQTGYHFLSRSTTFTETNKFFISLRFVLINDRDVDINKGKKPLFKKK